MTKEIEIPEGYEAKIVGNKVVIDLKDSKDEKMRKFLLKYFIFYKNHPDLYITPNKWQGVNTSDIIAYLERQKEQKPAEIDEYEIIKKHITEDALSDEVNKRLKECGWYVTYDKPAEWSEEFLRLMGITILQDGNQVCVLLGENLAEGIAGFGDTLADAVEEFKKEWRQFDRFRKATWKPSEQQMEALARATNRCVGVDDAKILVKLLEQLEKL